MRLLIFTQAVNTDNLAVGFFHRWLEEFSKVFDEIEVVCLEEGTHSLPANVHVHSLGKDQGASKFKYVLNVYHYVFTLKYDAVFVHMNEEYVVLAGWWWRLLGKKTILWRNFANGSWMTPIASRLANTVCYTSPSSFTARYAHAVKMPIGIDTTIFKPKEVLPPLDSVLFFGRLDGVKKVELFVEALALLRERGKKFSARLYGDPTYPDDPYATQIAHQAQPLVDAGMLALYPGVPNTQSPGIFASHGIYVNTTPSGSFDKTIGEGMAAGCIAITCNNAVQEVAPPEIFIHENTGAATAQALAAALSLSEMERTELVKKQRDFIIDQHSLQLLSTKLRALY